MYKRYDTFLSPVTVWLLRGRVWGGGVGDFLLLFLISVGIAVKMFFCFVLFFDHWLKWFLLYAAEMQIYDFVCLFVRFIFIFIKCQSWFVVKLLYCYALVLSYAFIWFFCGYYELSISVFHHHCHSDLQPSRWFITWAREPFFYILLIAICSWWHYDGIMNTQILYWRTEFQFECFALPGTCSTPFFFSPNNGIIVKFLLEV